MKSKQFLTTSIMMLMPLTIYAQGNIKRAFNLLTTSQPAKVESTHKLNKEPESGIKIGQLDVYEFTIPVSHHNLVEDIQQAFDQDKEKAYSMVSASTANKRLYNYTSLAVGGDDTGYPLGDIKDSRYIYALFLDPADQSKTHRYAYAMEWREGAKEIVGKLIVTYATTQQYRQSHHRMKRITINGQNLNFDSNSFPFGNSFPFDSSSVFVSDSLSFNFSKTTESWLSEFNTFKNLFLKNPNSAASNYYASYIYKLCKKADELDELEKKMVIRELEKLKKSTDDELMQQMFDTSINRLK
jgi:hypothetical protein